jgi:alcohol dehydrogenase (quinone), cytochrome c subunit
MNRMKLLAAALLVFGESTATIAQENATHANNGEYLARAGDCIACHSTRGGKAFAGGLRMGTPMGVIYSTNITPDPDTGIGNYSLRDFERAVRSGIAKDGHHLYPAMPYPSYAKITDEDVQALYIFFMKDVPPVKQANKPNEIPWYRRPRWPLAVWNTIFARAGAYVARPDRDRAWALVALVKRRAVGHSRKRPSTTAVVPISNARSSMPGPRPICAATCARSRVTRRYPGAPQERP